MFHKTENNISAIIFSGTFKNFTLRQLRLVVFVVLFFVVLNKGGSCLTSFSHSTPLPPHHLSPSPGWITSRTSRYPGTSFQTPPVLSALWNYPFQVFVAFKTAYFIFKSVHLLLDSPVTVSGKIVSFPCLDLRNGGSCLCWARRVEFIVYMAFDQGYREVSGFTGSRISENLSLKLISRNNCGREKSSLVFPQTADVFYSDMDISVCKLIT